MGTGDAENDFHPQPLQKADNELANFHAKNGIHANAFSGSASIAALTCRRRQEISRNLNMEIQIEILIEMRIHLLISLSNPADYLDQYPP